MKNQVFKSRFGWCLQGFVALIFGLDFIIKQNVSVADLAMLSVLQGLVLFLNLTTQYIISPNELIIKMGFFKFAAIPFGSIQKIETSRVLLSSPAPSWDRLAITYNAGSTIYISPDNKKQFAEMVQAKNPAVIVNVTSKN
ncbi:MAG: hypothetical protein CFE24_09190 [Flavobacterium sp. BFFFF2]|nr:MAG: hypothetical protein CFE24_09190 [Flavobacterium sp. BFFFF2]